MSFFPKIIAGPIDRWKHITRSFDDYRGITKNSFESGIQIFMIGFFKKTVLADHLCVFVDDVFYAPVAYNTFTTILAVISYSLQIYYDFSGYSDMAIGIAKILGFELKANFNLPYIAKNISEFWTRWHISLSSWLKDYLYISLGGSRKGVFRTYSNLFFVMLISGLWHGAGWTFIVWGGMHGIASCIHRLIKGFTDHMNKYFCIICNFCFVTLAWVMFRAESVYQALVIYKGIFTVHSGINQPFLWSYVSIICLVTGIFYSYINNTNESLEAHYFILDLSKFWSLVIFLVFCGLSILIGNFGNTAFIYGAF